jgi:hypothetical protein
MAIDPVQLEEILEVLRDKHATSFSCPEFSVVLAPAAPSEMTDLKRDIREGNAMSKAPAARGAFGHPSLWPGGTPPSFPRRERAPATEAITEDSE